MEIFFSENIDGNICRLDADESKHCVKVLRHRKGDAINVIDGRGTMMKCTITDDSAKGVEAMIDETSADWGGHPYRLTLAVSPTKNSDRYEWFAEKACEIGVDRIVPAIGQRSERKVFRTDRIAKLLISAAKQSLKGAVPQITETESVMEFIGKNGLQEGESADDTLRLIAYCFEDARRRRVSIREALGNFNGKEIIVMIGPEGDFSPEEAEFALSHGFVPVHLGNSRLRTETAAVTAAAAVYFRYMH